MEHPAGIQLPEIIHGCVTVAIRSSWKVTGSSCQHRSVPMGWKWPPCTPCPPSHPRQSLIFRGHPGWQEGGRDQARVLNTLMAQDSPKIVNLGERSPPCQGKPPLPGTRPPAPPDPAPRSPQAGHLKARKYHKPRQSHFFCSDLKSKQFIKGEVALIWGI